MYTRRSPEDRFDFDVLVGRRVPFVRSVLEPYGLVEIEVHRGRGNLPGMTTPIYECVIVLYFATLDGFMRGFEEQRERMDPGIREFTDMDPTVTVTEVVVGE